MYPNLKLQMWKRGVRQNRFAKSLGIDESMLSKIVNGYREPSDEIRQKIAALLQSDADWLFKPYRTRATATTAPEPGDFESMGN